MHAQFSYPSKKCKSAFQIIEIDLSCLFTAIYLKKHSSYVIAHDSPTFLVIYGKVLWKCWMKCGLFRKCGILGTDDFTVDWFSKNIFNLRNLSELTAYPKYIVSRLSQKAIQDNLSSHESRFPKQHLYTHHSWLLTT